MRAPSPPLLTMAMMREKRRCEMDAADFTHSHLDAIALVACDAATSIAALSDEKTHDGLLHELNGQIRATKADLRRFFKAVHNYHLAIRMRIGEIRRMNDERRAAKRLGAHAPSHRDIGAMIQMIRRAWTMACRRVAQAVRDPLLPETVRYQATCTDLMEFIEALWLRHESIASGCLEPGTGRTGAS